MKNLLVFFLLAVTISAAIAVPLPFALRRDEGGENEIEEWSGEDDNSSGNDGAYGEEDEEVGVAVLVFSEPVGYAIDANVFIFDDYENVEEIEDDGVDTGDDFVEDGELEQIDDGNDDDLDAKKKMAVKRIAKKLALQLRDTDEEGSGDSNDEGLIEEGVEDGQDDIDWDGSQDEEEESDLLFFVVVAEKAVSFDAYVIGAPGEEEEEDGEDDIDWYQYSEDDENGEDNGELSGDAEKKKKVAKRDAEEDELVTVLVFGEPQGSLFSVSVFSAPPPEDEDWYIEEDPEDDAEDGDDANEDNEDN